MHSTNPLAYYAEPGIMTSAGEYAPLFDDLPTDIPSLCRIVQGLMVHIFWAERYGLSLSEERKAEVQIRPVHQKLARIIELDPRPLNVARPLEKRLVGNCRDFTVLLVSILRHQSVAARARCGFGTYFLPNHFEDHWVAEYWNCAESRWVMVDAQLDEFQRVVLQIDFDVTDLPKGKFVTGGEAWQMCRSGRADPDSFGIFDMHGLWFVRGDHVRDFLALNKVEILPWDHEWGVLNKHDEQLTTQDWALLDRMAELAQADAFKEIRALYESEPSLQPPAEFVEAARAPA